MSIIDEYNRQLKLKHYQSDPAQLKVVEHLHRLQQQLQERHRKRQSIAWKLKSFFHLNKFTVEPDYKGCYIWGDVGRGKTWLMDMFYDTLDRNAARNEQKIRLHFHHFMQMIHDQLSLIKQRRNPLKYIARAFARRYQLICLDEFHVSDITDAMLLYGLLKTLFDEGVILLATSNQPADELYKNGLQRERFLPAIELIKTHTRSLELNGTEDHRLRLLEKADIWHLYESETDNSQQQLEKRFLELATCPARRKHSIHINYRRIETLLYTEDIIWLEFQVICGDQRASADYIEIARQFHTVFISHIPAMNDNHNDKARRFINMIDEFYDRNVNLICSAQTPPEALYSGSRLAFEFKRTVSRLQEMRSHEYMQRPHKNS